MRPTSWMMKLLFTVFFLFSFPANSVSGPTAPSLTGTKYSTSVQLDWNSINSCNATSYEIQESTNGSLWSTVYSGAGNSGGGSTGFARSARKARGGGGCNVIGGGPRFISLSSRTNAVYYYKIRACELGRCGSYGTMLQLGQPTFIPAPTSITVPTGTENGNFLVFWSTVTGATRYELQQQFNNGSWLEKYSGNALGIESSPSSSGNYKYRVKACNNIQCSSWRTSSTVSVILRPSAPSSITVPSFDANGNYAVNWSSISGATYTLSESINSGSWSVISSGSSNLSFSVSGRVNSFYKYSVKACKSGLCSAVKVSSFVEVLHPPQTTPIIVPTSTSVSGTYDVSWKKPATATYFNLQEKTGASNWISLGGNLTGLSYHLSGKESGSIGYRVRTCNQSGCSTWSPIRYVTILHIPSSPASIYVPTSTVINGTIPVSWSATGEVTTYTLQESKNNASWITVSSSITGINYSRTGRINGTYKYRIRACNASGCGGYRTSGNVTVHLPPPIPTSMNVPTSTSTNGTIALSWATASTATKYTLQELKSGGNWVTLSSTLTTTSYSRTGRDSGGYTYRIRACNSSGCSGYRTSTTTYVIKTPSSISVPSNDADGAYSISWAAVSGATGYQLEQKVGSGGWSSIYTGTARSKSVSSLGTNTYQYRVKAKYGSVSGGYRTSAATYVVKTPSSISVPSNDADGAYSISWPAVSGATGYQLEQKVGSGSWASIYNGTGVSKAMAGLATNTYQYRVKAKYGSVSGGYRTSAATYVVKTPASISVPSNDADGAYSVSWAAVSGASGYQLEQKVGSGSWASIYSGTGVSKAMSGLATNTYQYRVKAKYGSVSGGYRTSAATYVVKTPNSISVPSNDGDGAYSISWAAVSGASSYQLEQKVGSGSWASIYSGTSVAKSVSGQTNNTYQYRVKAKHGSVSGGYRTSSVVTVLLPPPIPASIATPTSTVTNGSYTISWPASSTATSYTLAEKVNGGNWSYTTVSSLSKSYSGRGNASYQYAIRGCNASACGGWKYSGTFNVLNKPAMPSSIITPSTNYTSSFTVSWPATSTATSYTLAQSVNGASWTHETVSGTSKNYTNRTNATYRYAVRACNSSGCSNYKYSNTFTNTLSPSSINVPSSSTTGSFTISWGQVTTATSYTLQESVNNGAWSTVASPTAANYSRTGRANGSYKYQVRACNASGCSAWRASSTITVLMPPPVPASLSVPTVTNTNGVIELSWSASATATEYTLQEQKNGGAWESGTLAATSYTRADRTNGHYIYRVRACNASGCSDWRTSSTVIVLLPPTTPSSITVPTSTVTDGNVDISWTASSTATSYTVQNSINNGSWTTLSSQGTTSYEQVVDADGNYSYRVNACNTSGCSDWKTSSAVTVVLPPAWRQTEFVSVSDTGGSNSTPSETIDLSASVLKGHAGVSGGQASYQIPIDLPPGRNGIQPKVSLSYNSQGGNGIAGVGWSLNAGSAISRCGATYAQDGFTRAVTFNADTDRLCFNGQRLITLSSNDSYGTSGTEYRTEMDRFVKVVQSGGINGSSTSFTVHRPGGSTATYGGNANSRFAPIGLTTSLTWKVTQESWADGNNTIDYEYDTSVTGEHLLSKIYYTGSAGTEGDRFVEFIHENRTDNSRSYMAGGQLITQRRLKNINTYRNSSNQIAKYKVGYAYSDASKRSLLNNIQQCGLNSGIEQCSPLTRFSWSETASKVVLDQYTVVDNDIFKYPLRGLSGEKFQAILPFGDIDGDGTLDSLSYYTSAEQEVIGTHEIELNNSAFDNLTFSTTTVMFDANQDGKTDNFKVDAGYLHIALSTTDGIGPFFNTGVSMPEIKDALLNAADYNGDGWPDLIIRKGQQPAYSNAKLYLYPHSGNANSPYSESQRQLVHTYGYNASNPGSPFDGISFVGDADGNGLPDILITNKVLENAFGVSSSWPRTFLLNQGGSFSSKNLPYLSRNTGIDSELFEFMMDVNGDSLVDWLYWERNEAKPNQPNELWYRLNNGKAEFTEAVSFNDAILASRSYATLANNAGKESIEFSFPKYSSAFKVMDIDGDGVPELLTPGERLLESCGKIYHGTVLKRVCGDEIYEQYQVAHTPEVNRPIPLGLDKSIYRYNAIKFELNAAGQIEPSTINTSFIGTPQASMVDMFGDGLVDMLFVFKTHVNTAIYPNLASSHLVAEEGHYISRNYGAGSGNSYSDYAATDYLKSVTDGIGNQNSWRYRPLSTGEASADQTKMYHTDHPYAGDGYIHFGSSMYVVQSFEQSNGVGGSNETEYGYKGAMYNLQGRGFTGFREIIEKDVSRNRVTTSVFKQKFPEVSLLESQTVKVNGTTVSTTQQTWADNPQHTISGVYHNINTSTTTHNYGLSGSNEQRSIVQQTIDTADATEHGNIKKHTKIVTDYIDGGSNSYQTVVDTVFTPDTSNWFLGKFESKTTTTNVTARGWASDPYTNTDTEQWQTLTVDSWDAEHHKPTQVTYTASGSNCTRVESTTLNSYGLPTQVSVTGDSSSCDALTARTTSSTYTKNGSSQADDGYLPYKVTNAKGHVTTTEYDMGLGVPTKVTASNSIITQTQYDAIGRPVQMSQTGSPTRYLRYLLASSGSHAPTHAKLMTRTTSAGIPSQETYLDSLGRSLRSATQAFDGSNYQYLDKKYDSLGHLTHESLPYYDGNTPEYTIFSGFDGFDRPTNRSLPNGESGGLISTYSYTGLKTDINVEGRTMSRTYGMQGLLYETIDAADNSNRFAYDGAGRPLVIQDANGQQIKASYNGFGHKTEVDDPNQGITTFGYSSLGELDTQTDENGVTQTFALDTLGRITSKTITGSNANGTASYTWDTLKKGMLSSESENGISRSYTYTSNLQLATSSVTVASSVGGDSVTRTVKHQYDGFYGRPKALTYPNNLTLEYRYNDTGYLNQTRNAASGYIYRTVTEMDAAGHLTGSQMANALLTQSSSYNSEGTMASTQVTSSLGLLHNHYYDQYDSFMNLTAERNAVSGLEKSYQYDNLNRLEQYSFSNSGFAIYDNPIKFAATVDYGYDAVGNLLKKSDYSINSNSAYEYGGSCGGPNRVCAITKELNHQRVTFSYDSRGNLLVGDDLTMTYNALDKPLSIIGRGPGNNTSTAFVYGSDNMRALQTRTVSGTTTKTHYVDKLFETDNDGSWRAYIADIAVLSYTPQKSHQLLYTLRDRLGSATTMVDHQGNVISRRYFDPFGRTATASVSGSFGDLLDTNRNRRGFTDHEHLNEQKLIHMNGRVYDYNMGRFMSVDPLIQSPTSTQSVNPYSYIMNNPLAGTDPTGYEAEVTEYKIKVSTTGSNIKQTVTATVSGSGKTQSVALSGGNGAAQNAVKNAIVGKLSGAGFKVSDIGGSKAISKSGTWNKSKASAISAKYDDVSVPSVDSAVAAMNSDPNDLGQTAGGTRRGTSTGNVLQPHLNARYNQLFEQIREINPNFSVARPSGNNRSNSEVRQLDIQLGNMRGALPVPYWPSNGGFQRIDIMTLRPGTIIDRYGSEMGTYVAPAGVPFTQRSLPPEHINLPLTQYRVVRPIPVYYGPATSHFGQFGGGIQYQLPNNVRSLRQGPKPYLELVK